MKSFLNYSKNRILYNFFRVLFVVLLAFLCTQCVHAESINHLLGSNCTNAISDFDIASNKNGYTLIHNKWESDYSSQYPYYLITYNKTNLIFQLHYFSSLPVLQNNNNTYSLTSNGYIQGNSYNNDVLTYSTGTTLTIFAPYNNKQYFYCQNYFESNFNLSSPYSWSFDYNSESYSFNTNDSVITIQNLLHPPVTPIEDPSEDPSSDSNFDLSNIENYLFLICLLLIIPITIKFLDVMFSSRGSDLK